MSAARCAPIDVEPQPLHERGVAVELRLLGEKQGGRESSQGELHAFSKDPRAQKARRRRMPPLHGVHTAAFRDEAAGAPKGGLKLISCAMLRAPHTPDVVCSLDASGQGAATKTQRAGLPRPDGHGCKRILLRL